MRSPYGDGSLQEKLARLGELFNVKDQDALTQLLGLVTDGVTTLDEQGQANWPQVGLKQLTYSLKQNVRRLLSLVRHRWKSVW